MGERLKEWAGRAALVAAAMASVATSGKKFKEEATLPAMTASEDKAHVLVVLSSKSPSVLYRYGAKGGGSLSPQSSAGERYSYLLPPGATVSSISIEGQCGDPLIGCDNRCPGPNTYVKVDRIDPAPAWTRVVTGDPIPITLTGAQAELEITVSSPETVTASAAPDGAENPHLVVGGPTDYARAPDAGPAHERTYSIHLTRHKDAPEGPLSSTYRPTLRAYGLCAAALGSCTAPDGPPPVILSARVTQR